MSKRKFEIGDKVKLSSRYSSKHHMGDNVGIVTSIGTHKERPFYFVSYETEGGKSLGAFYSYELEKYVEMKFKEGDKVVFTPEAKQWLEDKGYWGSGHKPHLSLIDPNKVYTISDVFSSIQRYELEGVNSVEASDEDLLPAIDSKFHAGDKVVLTEKAKKWLIDRRHINIDLHQVYTILEVTTFYGHSYRLKGINDICFFDDDLELFVKPEKTPFDQRTDRMKKWVDICNEYLKEFCDRHDYAYHPGDWIAGEVGGIIEISDMFVTMDNIRYDVDNDIPTEKFSDWYWNSVEHSELGLKYMNYPSYCKGAPDPYSPGQLQTIRDGQIKVRQAKEDLKKTMDELGGDFSKLLF